jgi:AcrR family transcriptional regulator
MPKRDPQHMAAQRERIVRSAIQSISERGVEGTSIARICKLSQLSAGAIYVHFQNKEEILSEALRYGSVTAHDLPDHWPALRAMILSLDDQMGFDILTVVRTRLHLQAESVHPGALHEQYRAMADAALQLLTQKLQAMMDNGSVKLRMTPLRTAFAINALINGMLSTGLATDRPLDELRADLAAALDCFVA